MSEYHPNSVTGEVYSLPPAQQIQGRNGQTYAKRSVVLRQVSYNQRTGDPIENYAEIEFFGNSAAQLDGLREGETVTACFDLRGSKYQDRQTGETRFFTKASGWRVERVAPAPVPEGTPYGLPQYPQGYGQAQAYGQQADPYGQRPQGNPVIYQATGTGEPRQPQPQPAGGQFPPRQEDDLPF